MYNSVEIADRIKETVKQRGKSIAGMLSDIGLGKNTVSKISAGTDILSLNLAKIADYLDCSVDYLLGRTEESSIPQNTISQSFTQKEIDLIMAYRQAEQNDKSIVNLALDKYIQTGQEKAASAG